MSRIAIVTGASGGIGSAIADRLSADGFTVVRADLDGASSPVDVADPDSVAQWAGALIADVGKVDVLVNNAGVWRHAAIADVSATDARRVLDVNLLGAWWCTQALVPVMSAGSAVVNLSSTAAAVASRALGLYPASKGGIEAMTRQLAIELGPRGIRVNAVAPGLIRTAATEARYADGSRDGLLAVLPLARAGTPEDIAAVTSFLASDDAGYVTGQVITVDGGLTVAGVGVP
ncbi:MAG: 2-hydroxycyclohexanecarboxyl-CoA dehydrogenase [Pseudonocardiales bacterium]|jgi:3-oxoacyl-[acyl-carrier protein] reductase|nr:2-hydroxycyclohexanecarboxyl-CoA dehydrogenase [Pseudonocardiales bacterium]